MINFDQIEPIFDRWPYNLSANTIDPHLISDENPFMGAY
jgi:hypothetical protein